MVFVLSALATNQFIRANGFDASSEDFETWLAGWHDSDCAEVSAGKQDSEFFRPILA